MLMVQWLAIWLTQRVCRATCQSGATPLWTTGTRTAPRLCTSPCSKARHVFCHARRACACHHTALAGHLECVKLILVASARVNVGLEGSSSLHMATCVGSLKAKQEAAVALTAVLLGQGGDPYARCEQLSLTAASLLAT